MKNDIKVKNGYRNLIKIMKSNNIYQNKEENIQKNKDQKNEISFLNNSYYKAYLYKVSRSLNKFQKKTNNINQNNNIKISFLIKLFIIFISISESNLRKLETKNEIIITMKGIGTYQQIISQNIDTPSEIIINGENAYIEPSFSYDLKYPINNITFIWNSPIKTCYNMFYNLENLLTVDLTNFDSSQVTDVKFFFSRCTSLKSINFKNFDTRKIQSMESMFSGCSSLVSLDLSKFDTSLVNSMRSMFSDCSSLVSLDLSNFNTTLLDKIEYMFNNAESLISLDLSNFDTSLITIMTNVFNGCKSLVYINLNSFIEHQNIYVVTTNMISDDCKDIIYCMNNENKNMNIYNELQKISKNNNCSNICFSNSSKKKIIKEKKICIDDCNKDDTYKYEYNNICYDSIQ